MSITDIRDIQKARYKKHLIENVYKVKYKNLFEDDYIKRSATRIVRKLKKSWFKENYYSFVDNGIITYISQKNPKSGLFNFRYKDLCLDLEGVNNIIEIFEDNNTRKLQYFHQLDQVNINTTIGYNSLQKWELEKSLCYDNTDNIRLSFYLNYIRQNLSTLVHSFDIEKLLNVKNEIMKHIINYYTKKKIDIEDFEILEKYCDDIYNKIYCNDSNSLEIYINYLLILDNIDKIKDELKSSKYNYSWLINIIENYTDYKLLNSFYFNQIDIIIIEKTNTYLNNIQKSLEKLIECQCCFNEFNKTDLVFDNDFIYCHKCSEIFCCSIRNTNQEVHTVDSYYYSDNESDNNSDNDGNDSDNYEVEEEDYDNSISL